MTEIEKIMDNLPNPAEVAAQRMERRAQHVAAVCAGLFAAATDITAMQKENGVEEGPEILLEGAALFVAKLFDGVLQGIGKAPSQARGELESAIKTALFASRRHGVN